MFAKALLQQISWLQALGRKKKKEARCVFEADSIRTCGPGLIPFFFFLFC
jgi:hypothetical protein